MRAIPVVALLLGLPAFAADPAPAESESAGSRPTMRQLSAAGSPQAPPSARALVDARAELGRRYPGLLTRSHTAAGAQLVADALIEAAIEEDDRALKWLMLAEARRVAVAAGDAAAIDRAILMASATFEFDELEEEYRSLKEIPLRGLAPQRAASLAEIAEKLAARAASDGRRDLAISAQALALRGWQRAGWVEAARKAAIRHDEMVAAP